MKVWMLWFQWEDGPQYEKLFQENNPPSIQKIMDIITQWECLHPEGVLQVGEAFLRGGSEHDFDFWKVGLKLVEVE